VTLEVRPWAHYWYVNLNGGTKVSICKVMYAWAASAANIGRSVDPYAEYEAQGFSYDLGVWSPTFTLVYRRTRIRGTSIEPQPDSPGGAACDNA
jgi:hypothetical protein